MENLGEHFRHIISVLRIIRAELYSTFYNLFTASVLVNTGLLFFCAHIFNQFTANKINACMSFKRENYYNDVCLISSWFYWQGDFSLGSRSRSGNCKTWNSDLSKWHWGKYILSSISSITSAHQCVLHHVTGWVVNVRCSSSHIVEFWSSG